MYRRQEDKRLILNTLPISHYVEKARWCLDKSGLKYEEEKDIGIFWVLTLGRMVPTLKIPGKNISIANSEDIIKYLYGHVKSQDEDKAKFLEPSAKAAALEKRMDLMAGHIRTYFYYNVSIQRHLGRSSNHSVLFRLWLQIKMGKKWH